MTTQVTDFRWRTESLMSNPASVWRAVLILAFSLCLPLAASREAGAEDPFLVVLGIAQDGGFPQAGCRNACCARAWDNPVLARHVSCVALVDPDSRQRWLIDCTPDFRHQLQQLDEIAPPAGDKAPSLDGIFLTHAHIGHYAGLVHLGREVIGASEVPVHAMPRMAELLRTAGPWSQLVDLKNIALQPLVANQPVRLNERLTVVPVAVPHRGEFSETVAFRISGPNQCALFLPDIDRWELWERKIEDELAAVDIAFLDATFFDGEELPGRNMAEVPHPLVAGTVQRFQPLVAEQRAKVHFIHFNHTNPLLDDSSAASRLVESAGMQIANEGLRVGL